MVDKSIYNVLASGSTGNCEIAHKNIMIDIGVSFSIIKPYLHAIQVVFISHIHQDHFKLSTLKKLQFERPSLRIIVADYMVEYLKELRNIDVLEYGTWYNYGNFKIMLGKLFHDVENSFIRIEKNGYKIFRATDTSHLTGITAPNYDLYCIEHNYKEETIFDQIAEKEAKGEYAYQKGSMNSHLSWEQAQEFYFNNKGENSQLIRLHESKNS